MEVAKKCTQVQEVRADIKLSEEVLAAQKKLDADPTNAELWMEKGIALRKQMLVREAIEAYSVGLSFDPFNALLYRHRGHAYINIRRFQEGAADLELSVRINPKNWDSWYHLGLAYYLMCDYERACKAYESCIAITDNDDSLAAITDWYWLTLMHLGETEKAAAAAKRITESSNVKENVNYYNRVLVYNGLKDPEEVIKMAEGLSDHRYATLCYGLSYYYELKGNMKRAHEILKEIVRRDETWSGFAECAAEVRLSQWKE